MAETRLRWLLLAYPKSFRRQYGDAVLEALARRRHEIDSDARFVRIVLGDLLFSVPRAWWTHGFRRRRIPRLPGERDSIMNTALTDIRHAVRRLTHKPGLAILAVLALSLGIGLTAAVFSIVNGVILRGLPFDEPWELMGISRVNLEEGPARLIGRSSDYLDVIERQATFDGIAAWWATNANVSPPGDDPQFVPSADITANLFEILGVRPAIGQPFTAEHEVPDSASVVIVGHRFWTERLGADPAVVGQTLRVNGAEAVVLGVMPEGFLFPFNQQIWHPLRIGSRTADRSAGPSLLMFGRLADGVTQAQGQADLTRIMGQLADEYPDSNAGMSLIIGPYVREIIGYQVPAFLFTMLGAVSLVLVIACANVANLLLARASSRTRDVAVSTALGAKRSRVAMQLLTEAGIIALLGAAIGIGLARVGIALFNNALLTSTGGGVPFWFRIGLDLRVLGFVLGLTIAATLLSGLVPALRASGVDVNEILKDSSRGGSSLRIGRLSKSLVVLEVALSCALLVAAGLMVRSIVNLANEDYAFDETGLFVSTIGLPPAEYPDPTSQRQFFGELADRLEEIPGVLGATIATNLPVVGFDNGRFALEGRTYQQDRDYPTARIGAVDDGYFDTLRVRAIEGRVLAQADDETAQPVVVVNESFVESHFPDESPIGARLAIRAVATTGVTERNDDVWHTIVGVVPDMFVESQLFILGPEAIYAPFAQRPASAANIAVRTSGDPLELTGAVRQAVASLNADIPIAAVSTLEDTIDNTQAFLEIFSVMFMIFGGAALFLATVGLYGVLAFSVAQRTHEVGLRVALGAAPRDVMRMVIRQGMLQLALGLAIGLVLAFLLGQGLTLVLYQVSTMDPVVLGGIALILAITGWVAAYIPARRATRVDPLVAMRLE